MILQRTAHIIVPTNHTRPPPAPRGFKEAHLYAELHMRSSGWRIWSVPKRIYGVPVLAMNSQTWGHQLIRPPPRPQRARTENNGRTESNGPKSSSRSGWQLCSVPTRNFGVPELALTIPSRGHQRTQPRPLPPAPTPMGPQTTSVCSRQVLGVLTKVFGVPGLSSINQRWGNQGTTLLPPPPTPPPPGAPNFRVLWCASFRCPHKKFWCPQAGLGHPQPRGRRQT